MTIGLIILIIVGAVAVILVGYVIGAYNSLVRLRTQANEAMSDIDVQTKRRYDLIPNLVETVKGYAKHEKEVFENVTKARTAAMKAGTLADKAEKENMLSNTLKSLFAVAENYPQLRANENFLALQEELSTTENKIEASRRFYNANVRDLTIKIQQFPSNIVAKMFGFKEMEMFEAAEEAREAVKVRF
jgi:LemA protein